MNQQINLYQPMFRRQEKIFSAMAMIQTVLLFVGILTVIYFYGQSQINPIEEQIRKTGNGLVKLREQVQIYREKAPPKSKSRLLEAEITRLEKELEERSKVRDLLEKQQIGTAPRFSSIMEALARQHVNGTWLTEVRISASGRALSLNGKTFTSDLVPIYMQRLAEEVVMTGIAFNNMEMQRSKEEAEAMSRRAMTFHISTN